MTKLTRIATLAGLLVAVAVPGTALAHGGGPGHDRSGDDSTAQTREDRADRAGDDGAVRRQEAESGRRGDDEARAERRAAKVQRKANRMRHTEFRGTVKAVDAAAETVTVTVARAQRGGRALRGKDVVFTVAAAARVQAADRNADGVRDLADVAAGDRVRVVARVSRAQLSAGLTSATAQRVKVYAPRVLQPVAPAA
jgi:hypothetical protein